MQDSSENKSLENNKKFNHILKAWMSHKLKANINGRESCQLPSKETAQLGSPKVSRNNRTALSQLPVENRMYQTVDAAYEEPTTQAKLNKAVIRQIQRGRYRD